MPLWGARPPLSKKACRSWTVGFGLLALLILSGCRQPSARENTLPADSLAAATPTAVRTLPSTVPVGAVETDGTTPEEPAEPVAAVAPVAPPFTNEFDLTTGSVVDESAIGRSVWPLVNEIAAIHRPGVLIRSGLAHVPVFDSSGLQTSARLVINEDAALFAVAPLRAGGQASQLYLDVSPNAVGLKLFAIQNRTVTVFVAEAELGQCQAAFTEASSFTGFAPRAQFPYLTGVNSVACATMSNVAGGEAASTRWVADLSMPKEPVDAFGLLAINLAGQRIDVRELSLTDSARSRSEPLQQARIVITGGPLTGQLWRQDFGQSPQQIAFDASGEHGLDLTTTPPGGQTRIWYELNEREYYLDRGAWIDLTDTTSVNRILVADDYNFTSSERARQISGTGPNSLAMWPGPQWIPVQEYEGLRFFNNTEPPRADRDHIAENVSGCTRVGYFGGSRVLARQTRMDQHPATIATEILNQQAATPCVEVFVDHFTSASFENFYGAILETNELYGIENFVVAIHEKSLCQADDLVYAHEYRVAPNTPVRWRIIDGAAVAPVRVSRAEAFTAEVDFEPEVHCDFSRQPLSAIETTVTAKMRTMQDLLQGVNPNISIAFFNEFDPLSARTLEAATIAGQCALVGVQCFDVDEPERIEHDPPLDRYSQYIYRFRHDDHPTIEANQVIGQSLAAVIEEMQAG